MKELGGKSENNPSLDKAWVMQGFSFFAPQDFFFAFKTQKIQKKAVWAYRLLFPNQKN